MFMSFTGASVVLHGGFFMNEENDTHENQAVTTYLLQS